MAHITGPATLRCIVNVFVVVVVVVVVVVCFGCINYKTFCSTSGCFAKLTKIVQIAICQQIPQIPI
jgi:hypothetical protein